MQASGRFEYTSGGGLLVLCKAWPSWTLPAEDAVEVQLSNGKASLYGKAKFYDADGEVIAEYRRPGGLLATHAKLVSRGGDLALSLTSYGSGSCPTRMESISLDSPNEIQVDLAASADRVCTLDVKRSTSVIAIPGRLELDGPVTATLRGTTAPFQVLLVDTSAVVGEPLLATSKNWNGTSVRTARLQGVLTVNERGCVSVGETVVMWPSTYMVVTDRAGTWAIADGYGPIVGVAGERVTLAGAMTTNDANSGTPPDATHSECLQGNYWTGIIQSQSDD